MGGPWLLNRIARNISIIPESSSRPCLREGPGLAARAGGLEFTRGIRLETPQNWILCRRQVSLFLGRELEGAHLEPVEKRTDQLGFSSSEAAGIYRLGCGGAVPGDHDTML